MKTMLRFSDLKIDLTNFRSISIPMKFNGPQPNTYGVPRGTSIPYAGAGFIGDVNQGGSCNFHQHVLIPHCNGTHTECVGHISTKLIAINEVLVQSFFAARLISVQPVSPSETGDTYVPDFTFDDRVITKRLLEEALGKAHSTEALIIRTLPNHWSKTSLDYRGENPPFFSKEGMAFLVERGVEHLLVDMPSVDRMHDEGKLCNHHTYWEVNMGAFEERESGYSQKTITEMVFVPEEVEDGLYGVEIQVPDWCSDAAPSRVRLYPVE
ncbi:MAG: cyclase family protein [Bacteroidota bacterium]